MPEYKVTFQQMFVAEGWRVVFADDEGMAADAVVDLLNGDPATDEINADGDIEILNVEPA